MPNYIYNTITLHNVSNDRQKKILEKIKESGLCEYFMPRPKELSITSGGNIPEARKILGDANAEIPTHEYITEKEFKEAKQSFLNEIKHGYQDWYDWSVANWGTKWGDIDLEIHDNVITYKTAWSPVSETIIYKLAEYFDFTLEWEEETGFGEEEEYVDGEKIYSVGWDTPDFVDVTIDDNEYQWLRSPYKDAQPGLYMDYVFEKESRVGDISLD